MSTLDKDLNSSYSDENCCKKKRLIPMPDSGFLSLRCPLCRETTIAFSNSNTPIACSHCKSALAFPTGGRIRLADCVEVVANNN